MEPNKFRESRQEINRMCKNINVLIEQKSLEASRESYQEVYTKLDNLKPQAEGKIQKRSVKNLTVKITALLTNIDKLKPKKSAAKKNGTNKTNSVIIWDEEQVGKLSPVFLKKVLANMGENEDSKVCFSATGKGIKPSYQIEFANTEITAFSGSTHNPLKNLLSSGTKKISQPFSHGVIDSIVFRS